MLNYINLRVTMTNAHIRVYIDSIYVYAVTYTHAPIYIYLYI